MKKSFNFIKEHPKIPITTILSILLVLFIYSCANKLYKDIPSEDQRYKCTENEGEIRELNGFYVCFKIKETKCNNQCICDITGSILEIYK